MGKQHLVIHEDEIEEKQLPGRLFRWLVRPDTVGTEFCAVSMIRVVPGAAVTPAHSHDKCEEIIYIISGRGEVLIDDKVYPLKAGSIAVFPQKVIHMLRNSGEIEMKVICFFAPPTDTSEYIFHELVRFPESTTPP
jgi:mannose-6-phosphate isomerase-like protein (cupin superfamily)